MVKDGPVWEVIPKTVQLIAGRTGHEFNQRKNRKGAFWEDRYHATAVEADFHLIQCIARERGQVSTINKKDKGARIRVQGIRTVMRME